jgi:FtsH-binding integral membrane protein
MSFQPSDSNQLNSPDVQIGVDTRAAFLTRTYVHLFGAIIAFVLIEVALFSSGMAEDIARAMLSVNWLFILGGFMVVSWIASRAAFSAKSVVAQYAALGGFVLAQALIFVPLLYIANSYAPGAIESAGTVTLIGFAGLTAVAFLSRKDFSFLGGLLKWGMVLALVAIVGGVLFGFNLGTWFSVGMVGLAGAAILYDTSNIIRNFPEDKHVGASLQLFASVALMFWYVLSLFLSRR